MIFFRKKYEYFSEYFFYNFGNFLKCFFMNYFILEKNPNFFSSIFGKKSEYFYDVLDFF